MSTIRLRQVWLSVVIFMILIQITYSIDCFVCQDCESTFNSSHLKQCRQDRCIKKVLVNGAVDRECGDKRKCAGRERRRRRSIPDYYDSSRRFARSLLGDKPKSKERDGTKESSSIHCCSENECNRGIVASLSPISLATAFTISFIRSMTAVN